MVRSRQGIPPSISLRSSFPVPGPAVPGLRRDACQQAWVLKKKHGLSAPHPHWKSDANESWTVRPCRRTCGGDKDVMTTAGDGRVMGGVGVGGGCHIAHQKGAERQR